MHQGYVISGGYDTKAEAKKALKEMKDRQRRRGNLWGRYSIVSKKLFGNPLRKRAKKSTTKRKARAGAATSLRSQEMRALQNPRKVKRSTAWISAVAVKIVKRRGQPDQVLIRKPGSKKRR
jgi:hypothetical protein